MKGFTQVVDTLSTKEFAQTIKPWLILEQKDLFYPEDNSLKLWVANEYIDWPHFRKTSEYKIRYQTHRRQTSESLSSGL